MSKPKRNVAPELVALATGLAAITPAAAGQLAEPLKLIEFHLADAINPSRSRPARARATRRAYDEIQALRRRLIALETAPEPLAAALPISPAS